MVTIYFFAAIAENKLHRRKRFRRVVTKQPHVYFPPFDILLQKNILVKLFENCSRRLFEFLLVSDDTKSQRHSFVFGFYNEGIFQAVSVYPGRFENGEVRCWKSVLHEDHLRDDFVESDRVSKRPRSNVRYPNHLKNAWYVRIPCPALYPVGEVKDDTGTFTAQNARHEFLQVIDEILVSFHSDG
jgi:hypothetical protein